VHDHGGSRIDPRHVEVYLDPVLAQVTDQSSRYGQSFVSTLFLLPVPGQLNGRRNGS
jgi:hypothetical protein